MTEEEKKAAEVAKVAEAAKAAEVAKAPIKTADQIVEEQRAAMMKSMADAQAAKDKATVEEKILITDFAGSQGGVFAIYGVNLDKGGQVTLNGQVPEVKVRRPFVIKGTLNAPGMDIKAGPIEVKIGTTVFKGTL